MSPYLIWTAVHFAKLSAGIENKYKLGDIDDIEEVKKEHRAYVIGSVVTIVSFLEASINEFFKDVIEDENNARLININQETKRILKVVWNVNRFEYSSFLYKYNLALLLIRGEQFDTGISPYQDIAHLITLRNTIVHFKPETLPAISDPETIPSGSDHNKLAKQIRSYIQGRLNPIFAGGNNPPFPDQYLSYGCTKWAIESSLHFSRSFFTTIDVTPHPHDFLSKKPDLPDLWME